MALSTVGTAMCKYGSLKCVFLLLRPLQKDYLIIIAISPKYHEVVAGDRMFVERDERTLNTVYIHKQVELIKV